MTQEQINTIIGELLTMEKYKLIGGRIIAEVVSDAAKIINDNQREKLKHENSSNQ